MKHVGDLLADLSLPVPDAPAELCSERAGEAGLRRPDLLHDLGADLPAGHLHLWGGPPGAGKTSFLLTLLLGAACRGRRGVYVSYHLPATTLALRLLALTSSIDAETLAAGVLDPGSLTPEQQAVAGAVRARLSRLPLYVLEARGYSVPSVEDRLVRMPFRAEVVAVDYLQAVVRDTPSDAGQTVRDLSSLACRHHVAIIAALQATDENASWDLAQLADRAGWIAPSGGSGLRRADVIRNRYGARSSVPLRLDRTSGALERMDRPPTGA